MANRNRSINQKEWWSKFGKMNRRVAKNEKTCRISVAWRAFKALLVYENPNIDVAILKINGTKNRFTPIDNPTRWSSDLKHGEPVYYCGGGKLHTGAGFYKSNISIPSLFKEDDTEIKITTPLLEIAIKIDPGSSGSPLFDDQGNVIGMLIAAGNETPEIGYAVPIEEIVSILSSFLKPNT